MISNRVNVKLSLSRLDDENKYLHIISEAWNSPTASPIDDLNHLWGDRGCFNSFHLHRKVFANFVSYLRVVDLSFEFDYSKSKFEWKGITFFIHHEEDWEKGMGVLLMDDNLVAVLKGLV